MKLSENPETRFFQQYFRHFFQSKTLVAYSELRVWWFMAKIFCHKNYLSIFPNRFYTGSSHIKVFSFCSKRY